MLLVGSFQVVPSILPSADHSSSFGKQFTLLRPLALVDFLAAERQESTRFIGESCHTNRERREKREVQREGEREREQSTEENDQREGREREKEVHYKQGRMGETR